LKKERKENSFFLLKMWKEIEKDKKEKRGI